MLTLFNTDNLFLFDVTFWRLRSNISQYSVGLMEDENITGCKWRCKYQTCDKYDVCLTFCWTNNRNVEINTNKTTGKSVRNQRNNIFLN